MSAHVGSGTLPVPRTPLIGRAADLATLRERILHADERVLTLTGVGGCGKTCLAIQLASELAPTFPGRIWLVELAALADPTLLPFVVAAALGVQEAAESSVHAAIAHALDTNSQPALLVLDNCEHLIDACAALADQLLAACPLLRILATSREPLQISGERQYRVTPLALPAPDHPPSVDTLADTPAVQLFLARAQAVAPDVRLTDENAALVAGICTRLDGIPLAIELAAARVRVLSLEQILTRLDDSFRLLVGGSRIAPTRQQTLRAALDWSDALLTPGERAFFWRLAVFAGEFHLDGVEAVCSDDTLPAPDILEVLTRLVDKSLVVVTQDERSAWYRLLEPVRQYALQGLTDSGEWATARARHATCYVLLAEQALPNLTGPEQGIWLARLEREMGNLRAALRWAQETEDWASALRLAAALVPFWEAHDHLAEGRRLLEMALAAPPDAVAPALRMRALVGAGRLTHMHGAYAEAQRLHSESLALARRLGDRHGIATALTELGMVTRRQGDYLRSMTSIEEGLALHRELGDEVGIAVALLNLGATLGDQGELPRAIEHLTDGLARFEALGDRRHIAIAQAVLGSVLLRKGDLEHATQLLAASLASHSQLGGWWFVSYLLTVLGRIQVATGQWETAARLLGAAQAIGDRVSSRISSVSYEELAATIRAHLSEDRFSALWAEGQALTFEQAVAAGLALAAPTAPAPTAGRPAPPTTLPLTRREREVADLIARGYTDRQIAEDLFITVGTAGVHVHRILGKLGLYSRVQVAEWLAGHEPLSNEHA